MLSLFLALAVAAQENNGDPAKTPEPGFREYKGVMLGMSAADTRKKLGAPQEKSDEQDFFSLSDKETVQVYYDKAKTVEAISVNYLGDSNDVPKAKAVLGTEIEAKPDGSMHRMVRFPKAGCWVSYSRTAGNDPLITITLKKL